MGTKTPAPLNLTMGCQVDPSCTVCKTTVERGQYTEIGKVKFWCTSWVSAPKCESCKQEMVPASDIEWKCPTETCPLHGKPLHVGIYPLRQVTLG
jgi:hypothetical protein